MGFSSLAQIVGTSATVCTVLQMLTPIPSCYKFCVRQTVGDMIVTPYVVAMTSCTLWMLYGIVVQDVAIIRVNAIGLVLQLLYVICYYIYCSRRSQVWEQVTFSCAAITSVLLYCLLEKDHDRLVLILGLICCCVTVLFFISPLANIGYVIRVWNSESLPRLLITATFIVSLQWTLYGFLIRDKFVQVTNSLGSFLSGLQLLLMLIIPGGSQHEKLIEDI